MTKETRQPARVDYEYERNGTANLFLWFEPLAGKRHVTVADRRTTRDFSEALRDLIESYPTADKMVLVMDNLNTHKPASFYDAFPPDEARRLIDRLEIHSTPKHGSWLNMAETELSVLTKQRLNRRIPDQPTLIAEVAAWEQPATPPAAASTGNSPPTTSEPNSIAFTRRFNPVEALG